MVEADDLTATVKRAEAELAAEQKAVEADRRAMATEHADAEVVARTNRRRAGRGCARPESRTRSRCSSSCRSRRHGVGVAQARDGICTVCHVRLRPQVFNTVLRNDQIIQCDSCQRILYSVPAAAPGHHRHVPQTGPVIRRRPRSEQDYDD